MSKGQQGKGSTNKPKLTTKDKADKKKAKEAARNAPVLPPVRGRATP